MALTAVEQTLLELLEIDSPTGGEALLAEVVEGWCVDAGWRVRRHGLCLVVDRPELGPPRIGFFGIWTWSPTGRWRRSLPIRSGSTAPAQAI